MSTNLTTASVGAHGFGCFSDSTIGAGSTYFEFLSETISAAKEHVRSEGISGTRSHRKERVRKGVTRVGGTLNLNPTPTELDYLLPKILGAAEATDVFALAETIPSFNIFLRRIAREFTYSGCKVASARFSGSSGTYLQLALDILGKTVSDAAAGTATLPSVNTDAPFVFMDCHTDAGGLFTVNTEDRDPFSFELTIDNVLNADRFNNSLTRTDIPAADRIVTLSFEVPYDAGGLNEDLHDMAIAGGAVTLKFANGDEFLQFSMPNVKFESRDPTINGKGELVLPLVGRAYQDGSSKELVVTHGEDS